MSAQVPGLLYRLEYELVTDGWEITFACPPRVAVTQPEFEITLEDGRATVEMLVRYPGEAGARRVVEAFLRGWEIAALLEAGAGDFRLEFRFAAVSGRETPTWQPPGGVRVSQVLVEVLIGKPPARTSYPPAPAGFAADELVERMWLRWRQYRDRHEGLSSVAYYCLTEIEFVGRSAGRQRRAGAAAWMNVSKPILDRLGELASTRGTPLDARKAAAKPYTQREREWVEAVIPVLIRRAGEVAAGAPGQALTMADLPRLP